MRLGVVAGLPPYITSITFYSRDVFVWCVLGGVLDPGPTGNVDQTCPPCDSHTAQVVREVDALMQGISLCGNVSAGPKRSVVVKPPSCAVPEISHQRHTSGSLPWDPTRIASSNQASTRSMISTLRHEHSQAGRPAG